MGKYAAGRGSQSPRGTSRETGHGSVPLPCPFSHYVPPSWLELVMASDLQIRLSSPPWLGLSTTPPPTSLPLCSLSSAWKPCSDLDPLLSWPLPPGTPSSRSAQLSSCPPSPLPCHSSSLDHPGVQETPAVSTSQALKSRAHLDSSADGRFRGIGLGGSQEGSYHTKTCRDAPALDTDKL